MKTRDTIPSASLPSVIARFNVIFIPLAIFVFILLFYGYHTLQSLQPGSLDSREQLFILENRGDMDVEQHFRDMYPEAWKAIVTQHSGQYSDFHGRFTFDTHVLNSLSEEHTLKIVSFMPAATAPVKTRTMVLKFSVIVSMLLLLLAVGVWSVARVQTNRENTTAELLITHEELKRKNEQLARLNASKDKFFSILAQDLQTPITRALELVHFTSENLDFFGKDEYRETTDTLLSSLENLRELLKNLFTWSGIQRGTLTPHPQTVDLGNIVKRNTSLLLPLAEDKQIIFKNSVPEETFIYADPTMVYAVVRNLISNALKFSFPDDSITIASTQHEDTIELTVSDSGVGIEAENIPKLFRDDVTYQTPGTSGEEGAGLGLLLCKQLMDENKGSIRVESEPEQGTCVLCHFPRKAV